MKTLVQVSVGMFLAVCLLTTYIGCKGEQGPPGPPGEGFTGLEGFAPGIKCGDCHSSDHDTLYYVAGRRYQWAQSKHARGGDLERNGPNCAGCHSTEGFHQMWRNNFASQVVNTVLHPSPPGCFACHSPHARANFSLRDTTPVTIASFVVGVPDAVFDYGAGNLCAKCHQTRTASPMSPKPDTSKTAMTDTITITSSRWYPHYGVQGQMLMGTGGFPFSGYPYTGNSNHMANPVIKQEGCPTCHMAEMAYPPNAGTGKGGGHTMNIRYEWEGTTGSVVTGCNQSGCHTGITSPDIPGASTGGVPAQTLTKRYLDTLKTMLLDTAIVNRFNAGPKKPWIVVSSTGEITVNASTASPLRIRPAAKAGALFNFLFVEHDRSEGVHNTKYTLELLRSSIDQLRP